MTRFVPLYNLILLDDDHHSYDYVVALLVTLFGMEIQKAYQCAVEVDGSGRCIIMTDALERVEFKRAQVDAFGPDPLIRSSRGAMSTTIEACP